MKRIEHNTGDFIFPFVEYSPKEMNDSEKLPLIIQLHGAGERGNGKEDLHLVDVHGFSKHIKDKEFPVIFVMPQCPSGDFWAGRVESLADFVQELIRHFPVDVDKVYLTGLSMGGFGTWYTAMAHPHLFAAIAPICGGGMAWNAASLTMPVWAFHGALDTIVSPMHSDEMVAALEKNGKDVKYTRLDGVGHDAWVYAYNDELVDWFLSHKR